MAVSDGDLDGLVGDTFPADIIQGVTIQALTTTAGPPVVVATLTGLSSGVQSTYAVGDSGEVTAVDDTTNAVDVKFSLPGFSYTQVFYAIAFSANSLLLSVVQSETVAAEGLFGSGNLASLSTTELSNTTVTSYELTGSFTGSLPCFVAGTRIGAVLVEDLKVGDDVDAVFAGRARIEWIGRRHVDCRRHPDPRKVWPVRIAAGAFGPGLPRRDLLLSPDHAVHVMDVLIPVKHLINDSTIAQVKVDDVVYYHVELPRHDLLLTEGLPTESYLDTGNRTDFENAGDVTRLFPDFASPEIDLMLQWESRACLPLVAQGPALDAARRRLGAPEAVAGGPTAAA